MGIAPAREFSAIDVAVGYVHTANVAYLTIYHGDFAVISPVDACGELWEGHTQERLHLYPILLHFANESLLHGE